ncbi:MAG TPA: hypothetical protein DEF51_00940 [Myxococcales bacterium]|nr:hypothetical protein [Myxococcales bacterium]
MPRRERELQARLGPALLLAKCLLAAAKLFDDVCGKHFALTRMHSACPGIDGTRSLAFRPTSSPIAVPIVEFTLQL